MGKNYRMFDCTCSKCKKAFKSRTKGRELCINCTTLEGYRNPKVKKVSKYKNSLNDRLKELAEYNKTTGQCLSYGQYQAKFNKQEV